jgi:outer membrane receptor for ferrienterochelin and colicins
MNLTRHSIALLGCTLLTYSTTFAHDSSVAEIDTCRNIDQVVVTGTRTPKLLKNAPVVTRVITADDIRRVDATHVGELLQEELPGVEFSFSMNQQTSLNLQGFGGTSVLFLVDGERLAGETLDNVDYSRLNLDNVGRIEIVRGAASSLYGSNAVGGVINLISKTEIAPWSLHLNSHYGAHNEWRYGGTLGFNRGKWNSQTNVQHTSVDAINLKRDGDYSTIYGNETWNVKERLIYRASDALKLTGRAGYFYRERYAQPTSDERYRDFSGGLKGEYSINETQQLEVAYSFDQYDKSDYERLLRKDIRDYSNVQNTVRALYNISFAEKHTLTVGGDYMYDYLQTYQFSDGDKQQYTADGFLQMDYNPTAHLNLLGGLRYDYYSEADVSNLSGKIAAMYKWTYASLRASYAGGFRAPTLKEMYMNFDMASIFMIYGNEDLKPERSHNFSMTGEFTRGGYNATVTGFYNRVSNRITTAWNRELAGQQYTNMADLDVSGINADASARWSCGLSARLSYAYTYEHIKKGEPLTSSTRPHCATARINYGKDWKHYGFDLSLSGRYLSAVTTDEYTSVTSYEETVRQRYPGYTLWKLTATQNIYNGIHVTCAVDNLFNYRPSYYYSNSPTTTGTTFSVGVAIDLEKFWE